MTFRCPVNVQTRSASAFTLLEMLLALSMVVTLLFVMTRVFDDLVDARRRIEQDSSVVEGATSVLDLLARAADTVVATDGAGEAGVVGDATSLQITRSGVATSRLNRREGIVSPLFDKHALDFAFQDGGFAVRDGDGGDWSRLVPDVFAIRFRYHDGNNWTDSWNSGAAGLPVAIECAIWTTPWPAGLWPEWIPEADRELEGEFGLAMEGAAPTDAFEGEFGSDASDPFSGAMTFLTAEAPMPRPDHVRMVAIIDAVPAGNLRGDGEVQR